MENLNSGCAQGGGDVMQPGLQGVLAQDFNGTPIMTSVSPQSQILIIHRPGNLWRGANADYFDAKALATHTEHYRALAARGLLVTAGPFLDGGGCMIVSGEVGFEEMRRFALDDPAVKSGLLSVDLHTWLPMFGPFSEPADDAPVRRADAAEQ